EALTDYLDKAFSEHTSKVACKNPKALYAPHIDPRVALDRYVEASSPLKNLQPKRVVMLATSHYAGWYPDLYEEQPFILVDKDFELPLGTIHRDADTIAALSDLEKGYGISSHDRAH